MFGFIGRARNRKQHLQKATDLTAVIQKMFTDLTFITRHRWLIDEMFSNAEDLSDRGTFVRGKKNPREFTIQAEKILET